MITKEKQPVRRHLRRLFTIALIASLFVFADLSLKDWISQNFATTNSEVRHSIRVHVPQRGKTTLDELIATRFESNTPEERELIIHSTRRFDGQPLARGAILPPGTLLLVGHRTFTLIPNHLEIRYAQNRGNGFGFIRSFESRRRSLETSRSNHRLAVTFLMILLVLLVAGAFFWMTIPDKSITSRRIRVTRIIIDLGIALFVGGGLANAIDRVYTGFVVDYIHIVSFDFPTFNLADIGLAVGFGFILLGAGVLALHDGPSKTSSEA